MWKYTPYRSDFLYHQAMRRHEHIDWSKVIIKFDTHGLQIKSIQVTLNESKSCVTSHEWKEISWGFIVVVAIGTKSL